VRVLRNLLLTLAVAFSAFGQTYTISTFAGGALPVNVPGTSAGIGSVDGVAVDSGGNVFITASDYNIVLRLSATSGVLTLVAGNGTKGFSGDNGPAASAQLDQPYGVAVDTAGNVYIADSSNYRIRKVSNGIITTVAGNGTQGLSGDNGPATSAELNYPLGIAVDSAGNLYIADTLSNRIRKVSNGVIATVAGNGTQGLSGDNGPATSAELDQPEGVAVDSAGNLYIADTLNNRVREVSNGAIATIAGGGIGCSQQTDAVGDGCPATSAQLGNPTGVALDPAGDLLIADEGNIRIRKVSEGVISTVAGYGNEYGFSGDNGPATSALLESPLGVTVDSAGNFYIADSGTERLREVSNGVITTIAGNGTGLGGDNGSATSAQLDQPSGAAVDSAGDLYIADTSNSRIRKVSNGVITTVAGNGTWGYSGDSGPATSAELSYPEGIAVDSASNLYIADTGTARVRKVSNGVITTVAGNGNFGYSGDNGPATSAALSYPRGIAVESPGNVYIADTSNNRIRQVSNGVITTVAGNGTPGFSGDNGAATNAELNSPWAIAVDSAGNLYVADTSNFRIREVSNGVITTVAGNGTQGLSGDNGPATSAQLCFPQGVTLDSAGNLYIADCSRVRRVSGGVITTIAGGGTTFGDNGPATSAELYPWGVSVDSLGDIYVADTADDRIRALIPSGSGCTYTVNPLSFAALAPYGGNLVANIQTASVCAWAVQSLPDWITFSGNAVNSGPGSVTLVAAPNPGAARSATVSIAGLPVSVAQATGALAVTPGGVVNDASYTAPVAAGSIAAAFGDFLLPAPVTDNSSPLLTSLSGLSLQFGNGALAPLFFASLGQVNLQVPWELAGQSQTTLTAALSGNSSAAQTVVLAAFAPAIFATNAQGTGQGAILDPSYILVDSSNPATAGSTYILIFCTGLGAVTNQPATGSPALSNPLSWTTTVPAVTIGGAPASGLEFYGLAPGYAGLYQVNALVSAASAKGNAVPVSISIAGATSNTVTIAVQ